MPKADPRLIPLRQYRSPRYWPTWILLGLMRAVAFLPFPVQMGVGRLLGTAGYFIARRRRHICQVNLQLCFPALSATELKTLVRKTFIANGIGLVEVAIAWYRNPEDYRRRVSVAGLEHLDAAIARGRGVLLLCAHFSTIEIGGFLFTLFRPMHVTYRPNRNRLFQAAMYNGRVRHFAGVHDRKDVRAALRSLKQGNVLWYAPDQDYGGRHSVFVPFFGQIAATITATARFAAANDSAVVFFSHYRRADNSGYHLQFSPVPDDYPVGDPEADAITTNKLVEAAIRKQPDQYLWLHRRFKTRPGGKAARPY